LLFSFATNYYFETHIWIFTFGVFFSSENLTNFCQLLENFLVFLDITKLRVGGGDIWSKLKTLIFWAWGKKKEKKRGEKMHS
jgi:hypothetical protein